MRTLREMEYSSLYFSDPCLELDQQIQLSWYTGWKEFDLYPLLAQWIMKAAVAVKATKILILGSSGGGLASLQISTLIPGSVALPFIPQTSISQYKVGRTSFAAQRQYLEVVMPHLKPKLPLEKLPPHIDWAEPMSDRLSAIRRYNDPQENYVYFVQNMNDITHVEQQYTPFRASIESGPNREKIKFIEYEGPPRAQSSKTINLPRARTKLTRLVTTNVTWIS